MSSTVSHAFRVQSRRDQMVLTTVKDSAKVKAKARGGYRRKARQLCYRGERHQRFQGPRDEALEEEVRASARDRRERSIQVMARWLHEQANAEEECPRPVEGERASGESSMVARETPGLHLGETGTAFGVAIMASPASGLSLITAFLVRGEGCE